MATCEQQLEHKNIEMGFTTKFDNNQGMVYMIGGEQCWQEIIDAINQADGFVSKQLKDWEEKAVDTSEYGLPSYEDYVDMRDSITEYTDGHLIVTSWRWNTSDVTPGNSGGLCIGDKDNASGAYWSCWEYTMREDGKFDDNPKSYLVNPTTFKQDSRLN